MNKLFFRCSNEQCERFGIQEEVEFIQADQDDADRNCDECTCKLQVSSVPFNVYRPDNKADGLGQLPTEHERAPIVRKAENELEKAYLDTVDKYNLTTGECLRVLSNVMHNGISSIAKYAIRHERHGRGDKPGDIA